MSKPLEGKTALVTGASRGIGRAIARHLARSGALVALNYGSSRGSAEDALEAIEEAGGRGFLLQARLGDAASANDLASRLKAELIERTGESGLDILINNVGDGISATLEATTPELFDDIVAVNMRAPFFVTQALAPELRSGGRVINISSEAARLALVEAPVYSMSKAAVNTFTVVMAKHLGPRGISVNAIMPGFTETERIAEKFTDQALRAQYAKNSVFGRIGEADDIAAVVHSLVLPDTGWVTGQIIEVSGGFLL